jgi:hypothetical protein
MMPDRIPEGVRLIHVGRYRIRLERRTIPRLVLTALALATAAGWAWVLW